MKKLRNLAIGITLALALAAAIPAASGASACSKCADSGGASVGACGQRFIEALFDALGGW